MPTHSRTLELLRLPLGQQVEIDERVVERRRVAHLAQQHLPSPEAALLDRASEASACLP